MGNTKENKPLKVLELFAGIGACSSALTRLNIDYEIVDAVEIDKYAIASFNAIHNTDFPVQNICEWDKDLEVDLIMHGSPCQDFSVAGKQAGGDENSGTRSSLMYETIRIVKKLKPTYVIWENVKNVLSKKHKHNFDNYLTTMSELGYVSYYQVLNAKDYGVPQNRERVFTVSILDDTKFAFPEKQKLVKRLKDILEENVDEKYYLKEEQIARIRNSNFMQERIRIQEKEVCDTLLARDWKDPKCVRIGGIFDTETSKHQAGSVYDENGICPTIDTMQGGWRQPCVEVKNATKKDYQEACEGNNDNMGVVTTYSPYVNKKYKEFYDKNGYVPEYFNPYNTTELKDVAPTLTAQGDSITKSGTVLKKENNLRIRKLTPKECWRLMGFDDEDFEKAAQVNSNTQLYKQARKLYCG